MNGSYLLDTNIVIALFEGDDAVPSQLELVLSVFIPSIVLGELYFGARKSQRATENVRRIDGFASERSVLGCGLAVAREYGRIKNELRQEGQPLPENDIWVATIARQHGLTVVTLNAHFQYIRSLKTKSWQLPHLLFDSLAVYASAFKNRSKSSSLL